MQAENGYDYMHGWSQERKIEHLQGSVKKANSELVVTEILDIFERNNFTVGRALHVLSKVEEAIKSNSYVKSFDQSTVDELKSRLKQRQEELNRVLLHQNENVDLTSVSV